MPRGQKSKLRARERHRQSRDVTQSVEGAPVTVAEEAGSASCSSPPFEGSLQSSPAAGMSKGLQIAAATAIAATGVLCSGATGGAKGQHEGGPPSSESSGPTERSQRDPLACRVSMLLFFLLQKYKLKEPITKGGMMKVIKRRYKEQFPEILRRASEHMEMTFGLDLKEADSQGQSYVLVSKLEITKEEIMMSASGFPRNGILFPLLGKIYTSGNRATEEEMWEFLNLLGIYDGKRHFIYGDARKLITEDLVQEEYLEYRQVPNTDPPRYEFLWGPRTHAEATKTKLMEFLTKIDYIDCDAFQTLKEKFWEMWIRDPEVVSGPGLVLLSGPVSVPE